MTLAHPQCHLPLPGETVLWSQYANEVISYAWQFFRQVGVEGTRNDVVTDRTRFARPTASMRAASHRRTKRWIWLEKPIEREEA